MKVQNFGNINDLSSNIQKNPNLEIQPDIQKTQQEDLGPILNTGAKIGKMTAMAGAEGISQAASWPGTLLSIAPEIGHFVAPETIPSYEQLQKMKYGKYLPQTPTQFRDIVFGGLVGDSLKPEGKIEENFDGASKIFWNYVIPGAGLGKTTSAALKLAGKVSAGGQTAKFLNKEVGGPDWLGEALSLATQFGVGLLQNYTDTMKFAKNIRKEAINSLPANVKGDITQTVFEGEGLQKKFADLAKSDKPAVTAEKTVKGFLENTLNQKADHWGNIPPEDVEITKLLAFRDSLSESISATPKSEQHYLLDIYRYINNSIIKAAKDYPEFVEKFKLSNEIFAADLSHSITSGLLGEYPGIANIVKHPVTQAILGVGGAGISAAIPGAAPYAAVAYIGSKLYDAAKLVATNSYAMNAYGKVVKASIPGYSTGLVKAAGSFDKVVDSVLKVQNFGRLNI